MPAGRSWRVSRIKVQLHLDLGGSGKDVGPDRSVRGAPGPADDSAVYSLHAEG